ncbi:MAG: PEP-CTERM sorting domain-containing protein [Phycisphaerae bacterium]|nr:PEP-CTERM sorting domain-containing protein [Phycisphaerae bacterium]
MKHLVAVLIAAVLLVPVAAFAEDIHPPTWRGDPGSTYQQWTFEDDTAWPPVYPEVDNNPYGEPVLDSATHDYERLGNYSGRDGILFDEMDNIVITLPNCGGSYDYKDIVLQVVWHWDGAPGYIWNPSVDFIETDMNVNLGGGWYYDYIYYRMDSAPAQETLTLDNAWGLYIDEIIIDTICIPEPASLALLGLGGLTIFRRRR